MNYLHFTALSILLSFLHPCRKKSLHGSGEKMYILAFKRKSCMLKISYKNKIFDQLKKIIRFRVWHVDSTLSGYNFNRLVHYINILIIIEVCVCSLLWRRTFVKGLIQSSYYHWNWSDIWQHWNLHFDLNKKWIIFWRVNWLFSLFVFFEIYIVYKSFLYYNLIKCMFSLLSV